MKINRTNSQRRGVSGLYKNNMPGRTRCLLCIKVDYVWDLGGEGAAFMYVRRLAKHRGCGGIGFKSVCASV